VSRERETVSHSAALTDAAWGRIGALGSRCVGTQSRHAAGKRAFRVEDLPPWLTPEAYLTRIQPKLAHVTTSSIATELGVSWAYASRINRGVSRPHARFWVKLGKLAGEIS
jgi:hypothetical protein